MSKCIGCGVNLQNKNQDKIGYTSNLDNELCERCFRIRNYNEYKFVIKDNNDYIKILDDINHTKDLVVLVLDLFNLSNNLDSILKHINNDMLLVLSKRDILPKSCNDQKFIDYINDYNLNIIDTVIISSKKNYNLDILFEKIKKYKKSNNVYFVGFTNSGKSTLINKIIYNYSDLDTTITTSNLPSTTIDSIHIKIDDSLTLIDTPGLICDGDILNNIDGETLKKIIPSGEINPITYQVKDSQTVFVDNLARIDVYDPTSMTIYMSSKLDINRTFKQTNKFLNLKKHDLYVPNDSDVVFQGLGFIKFTNKCRLSIYIDCANVFVRKNLI